MKVTSHKPLCLFLCALLCLGSHAQSLSGWPFGAGYQSVKFLHITKGNTYHIPCGTEADYDSIEIDKGGKLIIDDYTGKGNAWTTIGCKGSFILNGTIEVQNMNRAYAINRNWQLMLPDSLGNQTIPFFSYKIIQRKGGNGGNGTSTGGIGYPALGGVQYNGNGGGGGGTGFIYCCPKRVDTGGNANDTMSGYGGSVTNTQPNHYTKTRGVGLYGNNGDDLETATGASGGTRGKNGGLLFIKAMHSVVGMGTINASGTNGGNGGEVPYTEANRVRNVYSGGSGGGGAGGSGGYIYIKYVGDIPTVIIKVDAGKGGAGGNADFAGILPGQIGGDGDSGLAGKFLFDPIK
jgi:hypothetical protein